MEGAACRGAVLRHHRTGRLGPIRHKRIRLVDARHQPVEHAARLRVAAEPAGRGLTGVRHGLRPRRPRRDVPRALVLDRICLRGDLRVPCAHPIPKDEQAVARDS